MKHVIHDPIHMSRYGTYETEGAATRALKNAREKGWKIEGRKYNNKTLEGLCVVSLAEFLAADVEVEVESIMGGTVTIRKSQVGGPCDPSTERYWSM